MMRFAPMLAFLLVCVLFALLIWQKPNEGNGLPSPLVGKAFPELSLTNLADSKTEKINVSGKITIVNAFASWCVPCLMEHRYWADILLKHQVQLIGIGWRDTPEKISAWLEKHGNPYHSVFIDPQGKSTVELGLTGVPESYILDKHGIIRAKFATPLDGDIIAHDILPLLQQLENE